MAPDLNTLSTSPLPSNPSGAASSSNMVEPPNSTPRVESPAGESPRSATTLLQAAATLNLGLQHEAVRSSSGSSTVPRARRQSTSTTSGRRRSVVMMNLHLNDPTIPAPGEMVNEPSSQISNGYTTASPLPISGSPMMLPREPNHHRTPSLGELHQELEAEQEAQVNRLLQTIRQQQLQLIQLQAANGQVPEESAVSSQNGSTPPSAYPGHGGSFVQSHPRPIHPRSSFDLARADISNRQSRTSSRGASPRLRSTSISGDFGEGRDETAFYQAETSMLIRENQMLRHRIKELEKQLADPSSPASITHEPSHHSHLLQSTSADRGATPVPPDATASK